MTKYRFQSRRKGQRVDPVEEDGQKDQTRDLRAAQDFSFIPCCHIHLSHTQTWRVRESRHAHTRARMRSIKPGPPGWRPWVPFCLHSGLACDLPTVIIIIDSQVWLLYFVPFGYRDSLIDGLRRVSLEFPKDRTHPGRSSIGAILLTRTPCSAFSCVFLACRQIRKSQAEVPVPTHRLASPPFRQRC